MRDPASDANPVGQLGFWSAGVSAGSSLAFCVAVVPVQLRALAPPWDVVVPLVPSLLLAPAFLVLLVCVHSAAPAEKKVWSRLAMAFAGVYVPLVSTAYVVELLVVEPIVIRGEADRVALLTLTAGPGSILNAVDGLGYAFMGLATLFAAPVFTGGRLDRWIRGLFLANAVLVVPVLLTYFVNPAFLIVAAPWAITIPGSTSLLAVRFRRHAHAHVAPGAATSLLPRTDPARR